MGCPDLARASSTIPTTSAGSLTARRPTSKIRSPLANPLSAALLEGPTPTTITPSSPAPATALDGASVQPKNRTLAHGPLLVLFFLNVAAKEFADGYADDFFLSRSKQANLDRTPRRGSCNIPDQIMHICPCLPSIEVMIFPLGCSSCVVRNIAPSDRTAKTVDLIFSPTSATPTGEGAPTASTSPATAGDDARQRHEIMPITVARTTTKKMFLAAAGY
jgi:hypothetical protein